MGQSGLKWYEEIATDVAADLEKVSFQRSGPEETKRQVELAIASYIQLITEVEEKAEERGCLEGMKEMLKDIDSALKKNGYSEATWPRLKLQIAQLNCIPIDDL